MEHNVIRRQRAVVSVLLVLGLLVLWLQVHLGGPVVSIDTAVQRWVHGHSQPVIGPVAELIADVAFPPLVITVMLLVAAAVSVKRRASEPIILALVATLLVVVAVLALKHGVGRPGPTHNGSLAWPSGHTTTSVVASGVLVRLLGDGRRRLGALIVVLVPLLVGVSLVLRNYHWVSDVLAGWLLGPLILLAAATITRWVQPARHPAPPVTVPSVRAPAATRE